MCRRPMYQRSPPSRPRSSSMRPKKSPAPGRAQVLERLGDGDLDVLRGDLVGRRRRVDCSNRSIIASRQARANVSVVAARQRAPGTGRRSSRGSTIIGLTRPLGNREASPSDYESVSHASHEDHRRQPPATAESTVEADRSSRKSCWSRRSRSTACAASTDRVAARRTALAAAPAGRAATRAVRRARLPLRQPPADLPEAPRRRRRRRARSADHPSLVGHARRRAAIAESRWPSFAHGVRTR